MLTFEYTARDNTTGEKVKAEVQADNEKNAAKLIAEQGYSPIDITLKDSKRALFGSLSNRVGTKDKVLFSRQLSTLINAGLPLVQSLRTVAEQTQSSPLKVIIAQIISDVEGGSSLAKAMKRHPKVFNNVYTSLIAAGETSGTLDESLDRIASQQEKDAAIASKVRGALVYPAIVLFVIILVVIFMLTTVLPQVESLYDDLNQELPFLTQIMLALSRIIIDYWWLIVAAIAAAIFVWMRYIQTTNGRKVADQIKLSAPLFGKLFQKMYMARFTRAGTTLISSGVPMLEMLNITSNAVNNVHIADGIQRASEKVKGGMALSDAIVNDPRFLSLVPQMISIGEQSGNLDEMFNRTAVFYENELDNQIKAISTIIEPLLMVFLAITAGLMVGAILVPVYGLVGESIAL